MPEALLATRIANALVEDAQAKPWASTAAVERTLDRFRGHDGGVWVGGRASLTTAHLTFAANAMNRAVQTGTLDIVIALDTIVGVEVRRGLVTNIIEIRTPESVLKLRCFRAAGFAARIRETIGR